MTVLLGHLASILSTCPSTCNHLTPVIGDLKSFSDLHGHLTQSWCMDRQAGGTVLRIIKMKNIFIKAEEVQGSKKYTYFVDSESSPVGAADRERRAVDESIFSK